MALGFYTDYFDSAISPWTTLGPLAIVIGISITQEGVSDLARHRSDAQTNKHVCTVLTAEAQEGESPQSSGDAGGGEAQQKSGQIKHRTKRFKSKRHRATEDFLEAVNVTNCDIDGTVKERQVNIKFHSVQRCDIRAGQLVFIRNRDMIPCDVVLLSSSNDNGGAYIETSGIDGETNLKLRNSAKPSASMAASSIRKDVQTTSSSKAKSADVSKGEEHVTFEGKHMAAEGNREGLHEPPKFSDIASSPRTSALKADRKFARTKQSEKLPTPASNGSLLAAKPQCETLEEATARLANCTVLGCPRGQKATALLEIVQVENVKEPNDPIPGASPSVFRERLNHIRKGSLDQFESIKNQLTSHLPLPHHHSNTPRDGKGESEGNYVAVITCELPNASVHTFNGKLTLPPFAQGGRATEVPLSAENFLLRGAFLRNTEWAIGVACYTGKDTKLVKNSSSAPSRLSQLDKLV